MDYFKKYIPLPNIVSDSVIGKKQGCSLSTPSNNTMLPLSASDFLALGLCNAGFGEEWLICAFTFPLWHQEIITGHLAVLT